MNEKIKDFKDILAWQEAHKLVIMIYRATDKFPQSEIFGLTNQMRRAAVSITSNIAEGFGRNGYKEKIQFYYMAQGSLIELKNQILIAKDVGFLKQDGYEKIIEQADAAHRLLQGLITKSKSFLTPKS
ncbi:TPA: four helix bundle protein [Candidatus Wolfebacteria bacterium]|uniref:S23 ribosomal protein n=2 Tax=Candidatus Wolfeibacteriota TaxID=1752735 RepID=A0A0G1U8B8_9BACT|nr:MAG: S23 ribosomal protein [Candidatus Wolfebacteria bacterium GW2011_GWB1_47_1]KKU40967.1 MAG: hypothetical protein UX58_C0012G0014 [Candidatus Wolfebacteria bacterium GW2011_GWB2_46_69]KKU54409.1 MAG: hypothetical protein UX76_C0002G0002 [Candidatus Wolfebacteria bacterium GW2011_GWC1_47_103]KKU59737.1 MAG: hypothetical protein UX83_C0002G0024 [Candidatus Wolfebacteria bacterium GW2011_GWE2_47_12]KKU65728.1 MAG: hypothetical protein UX90_C0002G0104 [Candidatus Wolfebacteria bacterium GW201